MSIVVRIGKDSAAFFALKVGFVEDSSHVGVELPCRPGFIARSTVPRIAKGLQATRLAEGFLALTAAQRFPYHIIADCTDEERVKTFYGLALLEFPIFLRDQTRIEDWS